MILLSVPQNLVKAVKTILEGNGHKDRYRTIEKDLRPKYESWPPKFLIPTNLLPQQYAEFCEGGDEDPATKKMFLETLLNLGKFADEIEIVLNDEEAIPGHLARHRKTDPLNRIIGKWVHELPSEVKELVFPNLKPPGFICMPYVNYMVYNPMILLSTEFSRFLVLENDYSTHLESLYRKMCTEWRSTHIAMKSPILPSLPSGKSETAGTPELTPTAPNTLRSPTNFTPLYGSFGPTLPPDHIPTSQDLANAFWCSTRQNMIEQVWAPRYTMFSRGNISEKARILRLDTLKPERLGCSPAETSAVDLYAGIGYFAFSYAKAGVDKVLCWDINPWSNHGLMKGGWKNHWCVSTFADGQTNDLSIEMGRLFIFKESNELAASRVEALRGRIPPVRHVNCGYLPSSQASWRTAVQVLDPKLGGWVHAHENVAKDEIPRRAEEIVAIFKDLTEELLGASKRIEVTCEHIERVKSYAPGVYHCVYDIALTPVNATP